MVECRNERAENQGFGSSRATMEDRIEDERRLRESLQMVDPAPRPNDNDERRLWFDYVRTLNERQLSASQRSGVTTYVLLGTLVALLYRFGPQLPQFAAEPDQVRASLVLFVLLVVELTSFLIMIIVIGEYCAGDDEFRATPKTREALISGFYGAVAVVGVAFISLEVRIAVSSTDHFRRYVLLAHAFWLLLCVAFPIVRYRQFAKKAKGLSNPLPRFNLFRQPPQANLVSAVLPLIWSVLGAICLGRYLETFSDYGIRPFKAAGIGLITISILVYLLLRFLADASQQKYFGLERDIVLNRMTPAEIRERYLRDLSGPDMAQWLDDALATLEARENHLQREYEAAQGKLREITSINSEYRAERKERAKSAASNLRKAIDDCISHYQVLTFQTEIFVGSYKTPEENEALKQRLKLWTERFDAFVSRKSSVLALLGELEKMAEP